MGEISRGGHPDPELSKSREAIPIPIGQKVGSGRDRLSQTFKIVKASRKKSR